jgi:sensor histidine kinase regulating citrate/malate metabolism
MPEYLLVDCIGVLVDNAIEAVSENSIISLYLSSENNQVFIAIKNPGPYITDSLLKKMFETGYTTKNDTSKKHGLGLPFLQKCINQYNGSISCSNHIEDGVNFITFKIVV